MWQAKQAGEELRSNGCRPAAEAKWRACWVLLLAGSVFVSATTLIRAEDWPMWRYDAQRSAATGASLPDDLRLLWKRSFGPRVQAWDDPLNWDLMTYDRVFEPIVMDGRLYVGFNDRDQLMALDASTGEHLWSYYAEGPVRLPPVGSDGRVYFCSDDGFLYCVDAERGELIWKFNGAPSSQHVIGNRRLTSAWPARGGPVVRDGTVYFAASIWPFMGTFIYALDGDSGAIQWVNDSTGAQYIKQPHSAPSFAGVAPQGALVATDEYLVVPGGRSVPAVFKRADGTLEHFELNAGGKGTGGSFVAATQEQFFVHTRGRGTRAFHLQSGVKTAFMPNEPVLAENALYTTEVVDDEAYLRAYGSQRELLWELEIPGAGELIRAGDNLFAASGAQITAIRLPHDETAAEVLYSLDTEANVERLIAADGKLFAVTLSGDILAFGSEAPASPPVLADDPAQHAPWPAVVDEQVDQTARKLLAMGDAQGYAFWYGDADSELAEALAANSPFVQLAVVDRDQRRVESARRELDRLGLYGRVTVHRAQPQDFRPPPYVAHMTFVDQPTAERLSPKALTALYDVVRPYGGVMHLLTDEKVDELASRLEALKLEQARIDRHELGVSIYRDGALPGSADWTHQHGDIANTIKSNDQRVKLPLGVLWFGGSSNMDVLPRHGHGPPEQVVGGRLFIQGMDCLSARDVYTGRVLWKRQFQDLGTYDVYYDSTYSDEPLNPKYNQVHIPGANGRGTNFVVTEDMIYILERNVCLLLDPATGETLGEVRLPAGEDGETPEWGYIGVYEDVLLGGLGFANYRERHGLSFESDAELKSSRAGFGSKSFDRAASTALIGFDRHSGEQLWKQEAVHSFWHNGIVAGNGKLYCLDKNPSQVEDALRRRGQELPQTYRIVAFDHQSGEPQWEINDGVFGTWLGYSAEHDLLLQAGAKGSDRLYAEIGQGMSVYRGSDGSLQWQNESLAYAGPCILHNELIITNVNSYSQSAGAFYLKTGKRRMVKNPLTGELQPWTMTRAYGCNSIIASENLLTFRSGAAGFYDLLTDSGTGTLGGFKSGCTSNLVVANGVLNAPDYTRTCSCAYQNQTSLALVHMPEIDVWSINAEALQSSPDKRAQHLGINFGAPGDRRDTQGLLWLEHPALGGESPPLPIEMNQEAEFFQNHSSTAQEAAQPWVMASGVEKLTELTVGLTLQPLSELVKLAETASPESAAQYDIYLHFAAPHLSSEPRVFDVYAQGKLVVEDLTLDSTGEGQNFLVEVLRDIPLSHVLKLQFVAKQGQPVLCGIELHAKSQK